MRVAGDPARVDDSSGETVQIASSLAAVDGQGGRRVQTVSTRREKPADLGAAKLAPRPPRRNGGAGDVGAATAGSQAGRHGSMGS
jgi:hypothetical protein